MDQTPLNLASPTVPANDVVPLLVRYMYNRTALSHEQVRQVEDFLRRDWNLWDQAEKATLRREEVKGR